VELLNILEGYDLVQAGHNSTQYMHLLTEAMRRAYRDRALYLGDPAFNPDMPIERLTSKDYAGELRKYITLEQATKSEVKVQPLSGEGQDTTHFSVVDSKGNAASLTYSLNGDFGAYWVPEGTGVVLNNTMGDFDVRPGRADRMGRTDTRPNLIEPGKRPLSSMTPTIVAKDGKVIWVVGSPGGTTIITTNLQIMLNAIDFGMNIAEAVSSPRIYHGWYSDETLIEKGATTLDSLRLYEALGHKVRLMDWYLGPAMCIHVDHDEKLLYGAADPRSAIGVAMGY
jgi:gamma-glutamyltranspeptidase/glutathione hydrolase